LKKRIKRRIYKKLNLEYNDIDTLLIGLRDWFVRRINDEYKEQKESLLSYIESCLIDSEFDQIAVVDSDLVGKGELLVIPKKAKFQNNYW